MNDHNNTINLTIISSSSLHMQNQLHQHNHAHIRNPNSTHRHTVASHQKRSVESEGSSTVQYLNNRGCVNVTMGNYPEANRLFELALHKQMTITEAVTSNSSSLSRCSSCNSDQHNVDDATSRCAIHRNNHNNNYDYDYDYDYDDDDDDDISLDSDNDDRIECESESDGNITDDEDEYEIYESSSTNRRYHIQRMTTSSKLPISSYCGQRDHQQSSSDEMNKKHHEVYCLPIVMDHMEWESAPIDDKTFVLIFNTAVCNHLWGMYIQQQEHKQGDEDDQSKRAFLAANQLYRLALSHGNKVGRSTPNENDSHGRSNPASSSIDFQLCLVAVLNNLSHISKTLIGTDSCEAHQFDRMLLKAIFWWRDSREQRRTSPESIDVNYNSNFIYEYEVADAEIVDLFLEYVFHLIGVSESLAPAAVA